MKRFFRNLKALAMVAVVGVASLAVSCSEPYDDTQIKADIEDLTTRVEALETKLTNEVNTLKTLIDAKVAELNGAIDDAVESIEAVEAKIAILDYEQKEDGSWVLTTKGGETITIYPQFKENNEGLLTVIEENGVYYWAQIKDGKPVALVDADGNKYAAHHATVVPEFPTIPECEYVAPIVTETKNDDGTISYSVSFDGGKTSYPLGGAGDVVINNTSECNCVTLFEDAYLSNDGKSLTVVLNGGETFTTSLPEEFKFAVNSGKLFFAAGETKEAPMVLSAIKDCEVIAKPEGWKAVINGTKLAVTAPAEGGEEAGIVKVLAVTGENKAAIAKLYVSAGKGYRVEVVGKEEPVLDEMGEPVLDEDGNEVVEEVPYVSVVNEMVTEVDYGWEGIYTLHPALYFGMMPKAEFDANGGAQGVVDGITNYTYEYHTLTTEQAMFDEENPVSVTELPLEYIWLSSYGEPLEIVPGVEYVIWATTFTGDGWNDPYVLSAEDMVYTTYVKRELSVEEVSASFNDVQIEVNVSGYNSGYYVLFGALEYMTGWESNDFYYWQQGWDDFGFIRKDATFKGSLFDFGWDENGWSEKEVGLPAKDYLLLVLPIEDGKAAADYTTDDVQEFIFSTTALQSGGSIKPVITAAEIGYNNVKGNFEAEGAAMVYYNYYRAAAWSEEMEAYDNEAWVKALTSGGYVKLSTPFTYNLPGVNMGEEIRFAAVAVDKDGKYGEVAVEKFTTKDFEFKEGFTTTLALADADGGKSKVVTPTTTGGEAVKYRYQLVSNEWTWTSTYGGNYESAGKYIATQTNSYYFKEVAVADLVDGAFTLTGLSFGGKYWLVVMPVDAEGNFGQPTGAEFTPVMAGELVYADEAAWETGKPALELVSVECTYKEDAEYEEWSEYIVKVKLTPSADADLTYIARFDEEYEDSYPSEWSLMEYVVNKYNPSYDEEYLSYGYAMAYEGTDPVEITLYGNEYRGSSIYYGHHIYITWKKTVDGTDYYRECWKLNVREFAGLPLAPAEDGTEEGGEGDGGAVVAPL